MRLVEELVALPQRCLATGYSHGPQVDFEVNVPFVEPHLYLHTSVVEEAAGLLGCVKRDVYQQVIQERDALQAQVKDLERERAQLQRQVDAITVLENTSFVLKRRPGRPKAVASG